MLTGVASYDEEDDGFRFTRTRSKRVKAMRAVPEAVPENEDVSTAKGEEVGASNASTEAKPRAKRKSNDIAAPKEKGKAVEGPRPAQARKAAEAPRERRSEESAAAPARVETITDEPQRIVLPFSDTPVIRRNKEFRQRASKGHRRSSTGMRGRRASSLIESGSDGMRPFELPFARITLTDDDS